MLSILDLYMTRPGILHMTLGLRRRQAVNQPLPLLMEIKVYYPIVGILSNR
jgi:hypothetical protein